MSYRPHGIYRLTRVGRFNDRAMQILIRRMGNYGRSQWGRARHPTDLREMAKYATIPFDVKGDIIHALSSEVARPAVLALAMWP